jgi:hypothetical protein
MDRQYNGQTKTETEIHNDPQNTTQKLKIVKHALHEKPGVFRKDIQFLLHQWQPSCYTLSKRHIRRKDGWIVTTRNGTISIYSICRSYENATTYQWKVHDRQSLRVLLSFVLNRSHCQFIGIGLCLKQPLLFLFFLHPLFLEGFVLRNLQFSV